MTKNNEVLHKARSVIGKVVFFISIPLFWEAIVRLMNIPKYLLPAPSAIIAAFLENIWMWVPHILATNNEVVGGFAVAVVFGISCAVALTYSNYLRSTLYPIIMMFNCFPKSAIAPLFMIWFGLGLQSKIMMSFLVAFFPIIVNTSTGLMEISPEMIDLGRVLNASKTQEFLKIRFPHSLVSLFDALRTALPLAMVGAIVGEFVSSSVGLGFAIQMAGAYYVLMIAIDKMIITWRPSQRKR
jgi:NitT/TauT family transport system permease protein